jgi:hypothetical protein
MIKRNNRNQIVFNVCDKYGACVAEEFSESDAMYFPLEGVGTKGNLKKKAQARATLCT